MATMNDESTEDKLLYPRDIELIKAKEYPMLNGWTGLNEVFTQLTDQIFCRHDLS